jgi:hypothetical protein
MMSSDRSEAEFGAEGFRSACLQLVDAYRRSGTEARWTPTATNFGIGSKAKDLGYLSIQRTFSTSEEPKSRNVTVDYHVVFSESWQVPVLYFSPVWDDSQEPLCLEEVYSSIVEKTSGEALRDIGILGGISHGVLLIHDMFLNARIIHSLGFHFISYILVVLWIY